jgi:hypothetical protein
MAARASEWMAKVGETPQFLKRTLNADEARFLSPRFHSHTRKIPK